MGTAISAHATWSLRAVMSWCVACPSERVHVFNHVCLCHQPAWMLISTCKENRPRSQKSLFPDLARVSI